MVVFKVVSSGYFNLNEKKGEKLLNTRIYEAFFGVFFLNYEDNFKILNKFTNLCSIKFLDLFSLYDFKHRISN